MTILRLYITTTTFIDIPCEGVSLINKTTESETVLAKVDAQGRVIAPFLGFTPDADPSFVAESGIYEERSTGRIMNMQRDSIATPSATTGTLHEVQREPEP